MKLWSSSKRNCQLSEQNPPDWWRTCFVYGYERKKGIKGTVAGQTQKAVSGINIGRECTDTTLLIALNWNAQTLCRTQTARNDGGRMEESTSTSHTFLQARGPKSIFRGRKNHGQIPITFLQCAFFSKDLPTF
eukprot:scaffold9781_cov117-Cylindrotheca_fusiformis.AAC.2